MSKHQTFVEKYVLGQAKEEDILEEICLWHDSDGSLPLNDFLGLSPAEHMAFVSADENLLPILENYRAVYRRSQFRLIVGGKAIQPETLTG